MYERWKNVNTQMIKHCNKDKESAVGTFIINVRRFHASLLKLALLGMDKDLFGNIYRHL